MSGVWNTVKDGWETVKDTASDIGDKVGGTETDPGLFGTAKRKSVVADPNKDSFQNPHSAEIMQQIADRQAAIDGRTAPVADRTRIGQLERIGSAQSNLATLSPAERIAAANINRGEDQQARGYQTGLLEALSKQAQGNGIGQNLAANAYQKVNEQGLKNAMALAATAGVPAASANRSIADNISNLAAQNAQALSNDKMNAALAAQQQLAGLASDTRDQDMSVATNQAQLEQQARMSNQNAGNQFNMARFDAENNMNQFNTGLRQDSSKFNAGAANQRTMTQAELDQARNLANQEAELRSRGLNDAQIRALLDAQMGQAENDRQAQIAYETLLQKGNVYEDQSNQQAWDNAAANRQAVVRAGAEVAAKAASASDERTKTEIKNAGLTDDQIKATEKTYDQYKKDISPKGGKPGANLVSSIFGTSPEYAPRSSIKNNIVGAGAAFGDMIGSVANKKQKPFTQSAGSPADLVSQIKAQTDAMKANVGMTPPSESVAPPIAPSPSPQVMPGRRPMGIAGDLDPTTDAINSPVPTTRGIGGDMISPDQIDALKLSVDPADSLEAQPSLSSKDEKKDIEPAYETKLTPEEEEKFKAWKAANAPNDSGEDYDLRGAFKNNSQADPTSKHWEDTFKKPNHPTFSDQSMYAKGENYKKAGHWDGDTFVPAQKQLMKDEAMMKRARALEAQLNAMFKSPSAVSLSSEDEKTDIKTADPFSGSSSSGGSSQPKMSSQDYANNGGAFGSTPSQESKRSEFGYTPFAGDRTSNYGGESKSYIDQLKSAQGPTSPVYNRPQRAPAQGTPGLQTDQAQQSALLTYLQRMTAEREAAQKRAAALEEQLRNKAPSTLGSGAPGGRTPMASPPPSGDIAPTVMKDENYYGDKYSHPDSRDAQSMSASLPDRRYQLGTNYSDSYATPSGAYKAATVGMPAAVGGMGSQDPNDPNAVFPTGPGGKLETVTERKKREEMESWIASSDKRGKKDIKSKGGNDLLKEFIDSLVPYTYKYKNPDAPLAGEGDQAGVMAQDLQKSRIGRAAVKEDETGRLVVDYGKLGGQTLATAVIGVKSAEANEKRLDKIESKLERLLSQRKGKK